MLTRLGRACLVAMLVLLLAVTPISALISPGEFEVRYTWNGLSDRGYSVRLVDRTGLVNGLADAPWRRGVFDPVTSHGTDGRILIVDWEGSSCDYLTRLTLERALDGFVIRERTERTRCILGSGRSTTVAIHLWTPVDASTVELVSHDRQ